MKFIGEILNITLDLNDKKPIVTIKLNEDFTEELQKLMSCKPLTIILQKFIKKRSLNANNYMWQLLDKMARVLHTTKDELYIQMLETSGVFVYLAVQEDAIDNIKAVYRIVHDRGTSPMTTESGREITFHTLQCYKGTSKYNTEEMSQLLDEVVYEAKELGIQTETPENIRIMKERWGV